MNKEIKPTSLNSGSAKHVLKPPLLCNTCASKIITTLCSPRLPQPRSLGCSVEGLSSVIFQFPLSALQPTGAIMGEGERLWRCFWGCGVSVAAGTDLLFCRCPGASGRPRPQRALPGCARWCERQLESTHSYPDKTAANKHCHVCISNREDLKGAGKRLLIRLLTQELL